MTNDGVGPICPNGGISSGQMTALSPANTFVNRLRLRPSHTMRPDRNNKELRARDNDRRRVRGYGDKWIPHPPLS